MIRYDITVLKILSDANPRMVTTSTLWSEMLISDGRASYTGFTAALRSMEEKGQLIQVKGEDRARCKITDVGIARLAEATAE